MNRLSKLIFCSSPQQFGERPYANNAIENHKLLEHGSAAALNKFFFFCAAVRIDNLEIRPTTLANNELLTNAVHEGILAVVQISPEGSILIAPAQQQRHLCEAD
ncbi:MAG: hypothetical protein MRY74_14155 [Neomegalonema sp.]|nr:hypothetical protein [Neomegalonema sp.]